MYTNTAYCRGKRRCLDTQPVSLTLAHSSVYISIYSTYTHMYVHIKCIYKCVLIQPIAFGVLFLNLKTQNSIDYLDLQVSLATLWWQETDSIDFYRSFSAKEPLIIGLFCGKWPIKIILFSTSRWLRCIDKRLTGLRLRVIFRKRATNYWAAAKSY